MRSLLYLLVLVIGMISPVFAEEQTWVGKISDSDCGAQHKAQSDDKLLRKKRHSLLVARPPRHGLERSLARRARRSLWLVA